MASGTYFIQAGENGPIKIGKAGDVDKRLRDLQVSNHEELRLLLVLPRADVERFIHRRFAHCRRRGEWFEPTEDLLRFVTTQDPEDWRHGHFSQSRVDAIPSVKRAPPERCAAILGAGARCNLAVHEPNYYHEFWNGDLMCWWDEDSPHYFVGCTPKYELGCAPPDWPRLDAPWAARELRDWTRSKGLPDW